jgi:hypothetical protein
LTCRWWVPGDKNEEGLLEGYCYYQPPAVATYIDEETGDMLEFTVRPSPIETDYCHSHKPRPGKQK